MENLMFKCVSMQLLLIQKTWLMSLIIWDAYMGGLKTTDNV